MTVGAEITARMKDVKSVQSPVNKYTKAEHIEDKSHIVFVAIAESISPMHKTCHNHISHSLVPKDWTLSETPTYISDKRSLGDTLDTHAVKLHELS